MSWKMFIRKACVFFVVFLSLIFLTELEALEDKKEEDCEEMVQDATHSYVLPLCYDEDPALLIIPIPLEFKLAYNGSSYPDVMYLQFVPHHENINYWSELITICQSTETLDAHMFIRSFKSVIEKTHILDSYPNYTSYIRCGSERGIRVGYYVSEHPVIDPHQIGIQAPRYTELLKVKTVQSEDRVWIIQYAVRYDPLTMPEEQRDHLIKKIHDFFRTCKVSSNVTGSPL